MSFAPPGQIDLSAAPQVISSLEEGESFMQKGVNYSRAMVDTHYKSSGAFPEELLARHAKKTPLKLVQEVSQSYLGKRYKSLTDDGYKEIADVLVLERNFLQSTQRFYRFIERLHSHEKEKKRSYTNLQEIGEFAFNPSIFPHFYTQEGFAFFARTCLPSLVTGRHSKKQLEEIREELASESESVKELSKYFLFREEMFALKEELPEAIAPVRAYVFFYSMKLESDFSRIVMQRMSPVLYHLGAKEVRQLPDIGFAKSDEELLAIPLKRCQEITALFEKMLQQGYFQKLGETYRYIREKLDSGESAQEFVNSLPKQKEDVPLDIDDLLKELGESSAPKKKKKAKKPLPLTKLIPAKKRHERIEERLLLVRKIELVFHSRVRRWFKVDPANPQSIRSFGKGYARLDEAKLKTQILYHGFTPLVEKVIEIPEYKERYTLEIPRGFAMLAMVKHDKKNVIGIISYGVDEKLCFHRKFTPKRPEELLAGVKNIVQIEEFLEGGGDSLDDDFEKDTLVVDPKTEAITFTDTRNKAEIIVFPNK